MYKKLCGIAVASTLCSLGSANATTYTYNVDFTVGAVTITGTIQTSCDNNCFLGNYNPGHSENANVVSWSFTDGTSTLSSGGTNLMFVGSGVFLEATPTSIVDENVTGGQNQWSEDFQTSNMSAYLEFYNKASPAGDNTIYWHDGSISANTTFTGPETIATIATTPIPGTLPLLGGALAFLGFLFLRKGRNAPSAATA
jgi:hypothetical protein